MSEERSQDNSDTPASALKFVVPLSAATVLTLVFFCGQLYNRLETLEKKVTDIANNTTTMTRMEVKLEQLSLQVAEIRESQKARK